MCLSAVNIIAIFIIEIHPLLYYHLNLCGTSSLFCKFERERKKNHNSCAVQDDAEKYNNIIINRMLSWRQR